MNRLQTVKYEKPDGTYRTAQEEAKCGPLCLDLLDASLRCTPMMTAAPERMAVLLCGAAEKIRLAMERMRSEAVCDLEAMESELGQVMLLTSMIAGRMNLDIADATKAEFNRGSRMRNCPVRL